MEILNISISITKSIREVVKNQNWFFTVRLTVRGARREREGGKNEKKSGRERASDDCCATAKAEKGRKNGPLERVGASEGTPKERAGANG